MHKLIITGNGFDLAHGLKTSHKDFLEYIWTEVFNNPENELVRKLIDYNFKNEFHDQIKDCSSTNQLKEISKLFRVRSSLSSDLNYTYKDGWGDSQKTLKSKSLLFTNFNNQVSNGWADLEQIYYSIFKMIALNDKNNVAENHIRILNEDLQTLTNLLEEYLFKHVDPIIKKGHYIIDSSNDILKSLKLKTGNYDFLENYKKEFHAKYDSTLDEFFKKNIEYT